MNKLLLVVSVASVFWTAGCSKPPRANSFGTVTLDGKPIQSGLIDFLPAGSAGTSAGTAIKDGRYQIESDVCPMTVKITSADVTGKNKLYDTPDSATIDVVENRVPMRYNRQSELKADLKPGPNELNFDLTSDPKKK